MPLGGAKLVVLGLVCCVGISSSVFAQQSEKPSTADSPKGSYAVEDLILGDKVDPDTVTSRTYRCGPSEQFVGFTWCTNRTSRGRGYTTYSILHSLNERIVYANKTLEPAFSSSTEAKEELQRISQSLGTQPTIIDMPHRSGLPDGMMAVWGNVVLTPVDADNVKKLADGKSPKLGFMVDFVADFERSAGIGLPIYKISGGAGLVLAVSYGKSNRGTLRLIAVDASKFTSPTTDQAQVPVAAQASPAQDRAVIAAHSSPIPDRTAAKPTLQPTSASNELQTNVAELKHSIALLKADLANAAAKLSTLEIQNVETERQLKREAQESAQTKTQIEQTMLEKLNAAQSTSYVNRLFTILISMTIGGLLAVIASRSPTFRNEWNKLEVSSKLSSLVLFAERLQQKIWRKAAVSGKMFGRELDKHVAEINVTTQPRIITE